MEPGGTDARSGGEEGSMDGVTLVVMAAGVGSRYGGLKQIEPIGPNGEWILDYSVFDAVRAGFERVVFVVREEIEAEFRERFDRILGDVCRVDYVVQSLADLPTGFSLPADRSKPWGTGHAVWSCRGAIDTPFGVINADDFYGSGAFDLLFGFLSKEDHAKAEYALIGYELSKTLTKHGPVTRGICSVDDAGYLLEIVERHRVAERDGVAAYSEGGETWIQLSWEATVSMNAWGFGEALIEDLSRQFPQFLADHASDLIAAEFLLPEAVGSLVADGRVRVRVLATDESWFGVTFREDVLKVREQVAWLIEAGRYPVNLWSA